MRRPLLAAAAAVAATVLLGPSVPAAALDAVDTSRLRDAVTTDAMLGHARAFQAIADRDGGTRATGTRGYDDSVAYVASTLRSAGYRVRFQTVTFPFYRQLAPSTLAETAPDQRSMTTSTFVNSGSGDVTGPLVVAGGTTVPPVTQHKPASGCVAKDFSRAPSSKAVALVELGTCSVTVQTANARAAGYAAVIVFSWTSGSFVPQETLDAPVSIPVVGLSFVDGSALAVAAKAGTTTVRVTTSTDADAHRKARSVLADTGTGKTGTTVVVGGHLDSALGSPGINDNGSGNAAVLEVAVQMARLGYLKNGVLQRQIRFAFWAGGLNGQLGSKHYVATLSQSRRDQVYGYLDYRSLASRNYYLFTYDGDGSQTGDKGPVGSDRVQPGISLPSDWGGEALPYLQESDFAAFAAEGIPANGAETAGYGTYKDPRQGGNGPVGEPFDPCYHRACDTVANLSPTALGLMGDWVANATLVLAASTTGIFPDGS